MSEVVDEITGIQPQSRSCDWQTIHRTRHIKDPSDQGRHRAKESSIVEKIEGYSIAKYSLSPILNGVLGEKFKHHQNVMPSFRKLSSMPGSDGEVLWAQLERNKDTSFRLVVNCLLSIYQGELLYRDRIVIPVRLISKSSRGTIVLNKHNVGFKGQFGGQGFQMSVRANSFHVLYVLKANITTGKNTPLPTKPWKKNAANICDLVKKHYFLVTDDNSRIFLKLITRRFKPALLLDDSIVFRAFSQHVGAFQRYQQMRDNLRQLRFVCLLRNIIKHRNFQAHSFNSLI